MWLVVRQATEASSPIRPFFYIRVKRRTLVTFYVKLANTPTKQSPSEFISLESSPTAGGGVNFCATYEITQQNCQ